MEKEQLKRVRSMGPRWVKDCKSITGIKLKIKTSSRKTKSEVDYKWTPVNM